MPRTVRKARNRALFREVNERIADLSTAFGVNGTTQGFVCECHRLGCAEMVQLPMAVYARLRDDASAFVVVPGHEDPENETVVVSEDGYVVVREAA